MECTDDQEIADNPFVFLMHQAKLNSYLEGDENEQ